MDIRWHRILSAGLIAVALSVTTAFAQSASPLLVDTAWLSQHLSDRDLVVHPSTRLPGAAASTPEERLAVWEKDSAAGLTPASS